MILKSLYYQELRIVRKFDSSRDIKVYPMRKYSTEQRKLLLAFLEQHPDRQFSVEEIVESLCSNANISTSSVYRNINGMVEEGIVGRFPAKEGRGSLYQYIGNAACQAHIHMKCEQCGQLFHLDEETMSAIHASVGSVKGFTIDPKKTILYGSCENCD